MLVMLDRIRVIVFLTGDSTKPVFERMIDYDSNVKIKFDEMVSTLKFMFGKSSKVVFEL